VLGEDTMLPDYADGLQVHQTNTQEAEGDKSLFLVPL
jgi:hypothetical protein